MTASLILFLSKTLEIVLDLKCWCLNESYLNFKNWVPKTLSISTFGKQTMNLGTQAANYKSQIYPWYVLFIIVLFNTKFIVYHEADDYLKDNEYIIKGYRIGYNKILRVLKSLFMCHNESANIWSHIIGLLMFFAWIFYVCILLIDSSSNFENLILFHDSSKKNYKPIIFLLANIPNTFK